MSGVFTFRDLARAIRWKPWQAADLLEEWHEVGLVERVGDAWRFTAHGRDLIASAGFVAGRA